MLNLRHIYRFNNISFQRQIANRCYPSNVIETQNTQVTTRPALDVQADVISGAPEELKARTVKIFRPAKTAMQSGLAGTKLWKIDFDILEGAGRWENPLMGWASSGDPLQALKVEFKTKEQAILFAEKQGWNYSIQEPQKKKFRKTLYADNFTWTPSKIRYMRTK